jgi:hypothetical protein
MQESITFSTGTVSVDNLLSDFWGAIEAKKTTFADFRSEYDAIGGLHNMCPWTIMFFSKIS